MNTIFDMRNEMEYFYYHNEFEYNHDFDIVLWKNDDVLLVFVSLVSNVYLFEIDYYKFLL